MFKTLKHKTMKKNVFVIGFPSDLKLTPEIVGQICPLILRNITSIGNGCNINIISVSDLNIETLAEMIKNLFRLNHDVKIFNTPKKDNLLEKNFYSKEWVEIVKENTKGFDNLIVFYKKDHWKYHHEQDKFEFQEIVYKI